MLKNICPQLTVAKEMCDHYHDGLKGTTFPTGWVYGGPLRDRMVNIICLFILLSVFTESNMMPFLCSTQPVVHSYNIFSVMAELSSFLTLIRTFLNSGLLIHWFVLSHQKTHATGHWFKGTLIYMLLDSVWEA